MGTPHTPTADQQNIRECIKRETLNKEKCVLCCASSSVPLPPSSSGVAPVGRRRPGDDVGVINGQRIGLREFQSALRNMARQVPQEQRADQGQLVREVWDGYIRDILLMQEIKRLGIEVTDKELEIARNKTKALEKKVAAEKEKFADGLSGVLSNEQQVLFQISGREMVNDVKQRMRDHRKRGKDMGGFKKKRKRW